MGKETGYIVTCEHAGNDVPSEYARLFRGREAILGGYRGWDPGALECARALASKLSAPLFFSTVTRLLVDLNRSYGHPALFSEVTLGLSRKEKAVILDHYHRPHWSAVEAEVRQRTESRMTTVHIAVHSFTPVLDGVVRRADIGLLYDPGRKQELDYCRRWRDALRGRFPDFAVRRNYPYRGVANSLPTALRRRFPEWSYIGIEIEINQRFPLGGGKLWEEMKRAVVETVPAAGR